MPAANSFIVILALLIAQVLFGVHYIASKVLLAEFPPMVWACLRSVSSATVFLLVCLAMRKLQPRRVLRNLWPLLLFALLSTGLNQALFLSGLQHTTPTNSALLNTLIPVVTLFFVVLTGREKIDARLSVGFMVALIGVLVLMGFESLDFSSETFYGDVLTILNVVSYAVFMTFSRPFLAKNDSLWATTWMFLFGAVILSTISVPAWTGFTWPQWTPTLVGAAVFAVVGGTVLPYLFINWALARTDASKVALFVYIQPVIASLAGWVWLNNQPTARTIVSGILVFAGVALAVGKVRVSARTKSANQSSKSKVSNKKAA